jgi:hypothetical protein
MGAGSSWYRQGTCKPKTRSRDILSEQDQDPRPMDGFSMYFIASTMFGCEVLL